MTKYILDLQLSARLAKQYKAKKKDCYANAFRAWPDCPQGTVYVEGLATIERLGIPLEHGWLELPDGVTVVDTTWVQDAPVRYTPVRRFTLSEALDILEANGSIMPLGWGLTKSDDYIGVYKRAHEPEED